MPEGVDRLVDALTMLIGDLAAPVPTWSPAHHLRLDACFGFRPDDLPRHRPTRFSRAVLGDFGSIAAAEVAHLEQAEHQAWALGELVGVIEAEIGRLIAHGGTIDAASLAEDRADAIALAHLDPGRDGALAHRYVAAAARDLSRTLRDLHLVEARHGTGPDAEGGSGPVGGPEVDPEPGLAPEPGPIATVEASPEPGPEAGTIPNPLPANEVGTPVGSFGGPAPAVPVVAPAGAPPASTAAPAHALRPVHTAEPAVFYPPVRY